jgi:RNA polymerase sigma factor (sigma-70 family)
MITIAMNSSSDMELVAGSLSGNRDAFGLIVSRYQNLICSLAYSATGNLSQSEDLAQETFFTAWKQLAELREPAKLRAWLCGIARNLINSALRRQGREPVHRAETLEAADDSPAPERLPAEQTISNEEQAILWRSLERIPDIYREPLVLFYREHQSIEAVAESLDLTEDAVKQRLSRGRKLLQEEVAAFVEGALRQSAPGQAFAGAVLSALPLKTVTLASTGAAGATAAKSGGILSFITLPFIGIFGSAFGSIWAIRNATNPVQKSMLKRGLGGIWLAVAYVIAAQMIAGVARQHWDWTPHVYALVQTGIFWLFGFFLLTCQVVFFNHHRQMRLLREHGAAAGTGGGGWQIASQKNLFAGLRGLLAWSAMMVGGLAWLVGVAYDAGDSLAVGIIMTVGAICVAWPVLLNSWLGENGAKFSRLSFVPATLMYGVILVMVNWRLDLWMATGNGSHNGMGLAAAHELLPMWVIHAGTALLVLWVGALIAIMAPKKPVAE